MAKKEAPEAAVEAQADPVARKAALLAELAEIEAAEKLAAKVEYPKALYHESGESRVVEHAGEHEALGEGWHESPAQAAEAVKAKE